MRDRATRAQISYPAAGGGHSRCVRHAWMAYHPSDAYTGSVARLHERTTGGIVVTRRAIRRSCSGKQQFYDALDALFHYEAGHTQSWSTSQGLEWPWQRASRWCAGVLVRLLLPMNLTEWASKRGMFIGPLEMALRPGRVDPRYADPHRRVSGWARQHSYATCSLRALSPLV